MCILLRCACRFPAAQIHFANERKNMLCTKCGANNPVEALFCGKCGTALANRPPAVPPAQTHRPDSDSKKNSNAKMMLLIGALALILIGVFVAVVAVSVSTANKNSAHNSLPASENNGTRPPPND